ncbi:MAG: J domain-containing protein [Spirochaetota bacterium]|nr:J domain-containing protein [Spirochaetota bacterium]
MNTRKTRKKNMENHLIHTPYEILGVPGDSADREIRKAYLQRIKEFPPERNPEEFKRIRKAYGILKNIEARKKLDLSLFRSISDIEVDTYVPDNFKELFAERVFQLLVVSSDLYIKDFSSHFTNIESEIEALN